VVIKEYRRGGLLRFMRRRHYIRIGPTRPEREFRNLRAARDAGLNVPEPVLSVSRGMLFYRGWLVTRFVAGRSLVDVVSSGTDGIPDMLDDLTRQVGLLIERRLAHVDLHPGNVLVDAAGRLYLLDFDRVFAFDEPAEELRRRYEVRWRRAVEKHELPAILADRFSEGLARLSLPAD
jgi:tRNA A-37 threonylcarbamoyl transferase component Bud32